MDEERQVASSKDSHLKTVKERVDNFTTAPEDRRKYRGLELTNGMKILLVSDPIRSNKSAMALDLNIGKWMPFLFNFGARRKSISEAAVCFHKFPLLEQN